MVTSAAQKGKDEECPTCMGKKGVGTKIIEEINDVGSEWESSKITDGRLLTPDNTCPTCKGKGPAGKK